MAFTSSLSAFGLKPATTSAPQPQTGTSSFANAPPLGQNQNQQQQQQNIFSTFGQNTQQPNQQTTLPTGSLFGQPQQQNQQTLPPGSLFGQPQTQNQTTGNLFGQQPQQPQQQNQTLPAGSLFGQQQQQPQQQNQTLPPGSLFGQPQQQNSAGSLFGQSQQQSQQTLPPGSLFGQQQQPQQPQQPTSIFGSGGFGTSTNTSNTPQPQQNANAFGLGTFGTNTQQQQQPQQQNLFTTNTTNPLQAHPTLQSGAFGTNPGTNAFSPMGANPLFNKSQQPLGQSSSFTNSAGPPPFTKSTKFNDLPDSIKRVLEQIDSHIQGRVQISKDLQQRKLGDEATKGHESIRALHKDLINTATIIRNDLHLTQDVKTKVDQAVEDTIVATRIIDGFRNPQSGNTYLKDHASFPLEYFTRVADQMKERLTWYKATIEQIERKLSSSAASAQTPQGISATLQVQHKTFLSLASKTAAVDAELEKIKALYTQLWRAKTGSVRDPFNDNVKRSETPVDFGLGSLNVR